MLQVAYKNLAVGALTPGELYAKVRSWDSVILQSGNRGRFSIIGFDPFVKIEARDGKCCVARKGEGTKWNELEFEAEALDVLQDLIDEFQVNVPDRLREISFCGGAIGYLSYDYGVKLNGVESKVKDEIGTLDLYFLLCDKCFVFDHQAGVLWLIALGFDQAVAAEELVKMEKLLDVEAADFDGGDFSGEKKPESNLDQESYQQKIGEVKGYLVEGETYEVNFAHRFYGKSLKDPWEIYCDLNRKNPSPFMCYFQGSEKTNIQIVSNSPERLVVCHDGVLETRPIKGTVPRGATPEEKAKNEKQLLASEKNEAELNMIVDLARNDLGRVAEIGSVEVTEHRVVEKYSHVMHTMSNIRAKKRDDASFADVVRAVFPGGSVTGAPKIRTMELIDRLEDYRRGAYCGSAGYVSFNGNFDLNIMIRTLTCKGGEVWFHSGGAIVMDSVAEEEWEETLEKAGALREAL